MIRSIEQLRSLLGYSLITATAAMGGIAVWEGHFAHGPSQAYAQQAVAADSARGSLQNEAAIAGADQLSAAFRNVARSLKPSVVSIRSVVEAKPAVRTGRRGQQLQPNLPPNFPPEFRQFFGNGFPGFDFEMPEESQSNRPQREGMGSGVIVSANGHILTNNHVVVGADKLEVQLSDKRTLEAKVIGTDPKSDIAVIKVEATGLVAARIGDSSLMQVGDWVVAIGSPFELKQTVTSGIVSATNRDDVGITAYDDFIQTDAAINPGNSGGPLLNLHGEVIGINTAIASRSGGFNGIGFAIPSNTADHVLKSIIKSGKVTRGFIGIKPDEITPEVAKEMKLPADTQGALISIVHKGQPADVRGLKAGDIVTGVNGQKIESASQLRRIVAAITPGSTTQFDILRNNKTISVSIVVDEQTDAKLAAIQGSSVISALGIPVEALNNETAKALNLSQDEAGVVIGKVDRNSPIARVVSRGELIVSVNNESVSTPEELAAVIGKSKFPLRMVIRDATSERIITISP